MHAGKTSKYIKSKLKTLFFFFEVEALCPKVEVPLTFLSEESSVVSGRGGQPGYLATSTSSLCVFVGGGIEHRMSPMLGRLH